MGDRFFEQQSPRRGTGRVGLQSGFDIRGIEEIAHILDTILPKEANNLLRSTTDGIASEIAKKARTNARNRRIPADIPKAIKHRRKKSPPDKPTSIVFVEHGRGAKHDAWYWHFWEFGTVTRVIKTGKFAGRIVGRIFEQPFIRPAIDAIVAKLPQIIREQFQKKLSARIKTVKKKMAVAA